MVLDLKCRKGLNGGRNNFKEEGKTGTPLEK